MGRRRTGISATLIEFGCWLTIDFGSRWLERNTGRVEDSFPTSTTSTTSATSTTEPRWRRASFGRRSSTCWAWGRRRRRRRRYRRPPRRRRCLSYWPQQSLAFPKIIFLRMPSTIPYQLKPVFQKPRSNPASSILCRRLSSAKRRRLASLRTFQDHATIVQWKPWTEWFLKTIQAGGERRAVAGTERPPTRSVAGRLGRRRRRRIEWNASGSSGGRDVVGDDHLDDDDHQHFRIGQ